MDDLSGQVIKGYELQERIGQGGLGAVYRAFQPVVNREVAIKVILPQYANHPDFIRRFEVEAQLIARLEHPHIVPLFDYWREPDGAYLVMRYLRGGSLREELKAGYWSVEDTARLLNEIAAALTVAHRQGVVHRDVKPANILLDEAGNAYLADFGIAKSLRAGEDATQPGAMVGSPAYISPEQVQGEPVTPLADIYNLGVVLYELLTGEHPFPGVTPSTLPFKHLTAPIPPLQNIRADLPIELDKVIQQATAKNPEHRFADAAALVAAFEYAASGQIPGTSDRSGIATGRHESRELLTDTTTAIGLEYTVENPYKGLRAFQEADANDFFGREALVERLLARLSEEEDTSSFLAVIGPSGSGKSSVVRAGLIPALRHGQLPGSERWFIVQMIPGALPFEELEAALLRVAVNPPDTLINQLREDERGLIRAIKRVLPDDNGELLLVVDQFEELFTLVEDEAVRALFLDSLLEAALDSQGRVHIVVTMRADFYDRPLLYPGFGELFRKRNETVMPLSPEEIARAIVEPAAQVGIKPESGLVAAIVNDVGEQPGALPLLQYTLTELFEARDGYLMTLDAYQASGGVLGTLSRRAELLYEQLNAQEQEATRQLFLRLVTLGEGTEDTRRRVRWAELPAGSAVEVVIQAFGDARLLTFDRSPITREPTVEVAHEALISQWGRLRFWLEDHREELHIHRRLTAASDEWLAADRDPSFLARGMRLDQFEVWARTTGLALNENEAEYLTVSTADRQARQALDEQRKAHEAALQRRAVNRLRYLVGVLLIAIIVAVVLVVFALDREGQAHDNAATATHALGQAQQRGTAVAEQIEIAENNLREAWNTQALFLASLSGQELANGYLQNALLLALESLKHYPDGIYNLESSTALISALTYPYQEIAYLPHEATVAGAVWNADESLILSWSSDGTVRVWDATSYEQRLHLLHEDQVYGATWNADESLILSWSGEIVRAPGIVHVWDADSGQEILSFHHEKRVYGATWNADETLILTWSSDNSARVWDAFSGEERLRLNHREALEGAAWNSNEASILTWSWDGTARVWDAATGQELLSLRHEDRVRGAAWNNAETHILTWSTDQTARVWDAATGEELFLLPHQGWVNGAAWNRDETHILTWSGYPDDQTRVWDATSGDLLLALPDDGIVNGAAWDNNEERILTWSSDGAGEFGTARIWDASSGEELNRLRQEEWINGAAWNENGTAVLTWSADFSGTQGTVKVWDVSSNESQLTLRHESGVRGAAWNGDETQLLTWSGDGSVRVWGRDSTSSDTPLLQLGLHNYGMLRSAVWSRDETRILARYSDHTIRVWDLANGEAQLVLRFEGTVDRAMWNDDETLILTESNAEAGSPGPVRVWDASSGEERLVLPYEGRIGGAVWNHDESIILTWSYDDTARVWDASSGEELLTLQHEGSVGGAMWNDDETRILSWSNSPISQVALVWDAESGLELLRVRHAGDVRGAAWIGDGSRFLTWSADGTARVWDTASGQEQLRMVHDGAGLWGPSTNSDRTRVLTWSTNGFAQVWDSTLGQELFRLDHAGIVRGAVWNGDETCILVWSNDTLSSLGIVQVVDATTGLILLRLDHEEGVSDAAWDSDETFILTLSTNPSTLSGTVHIWDAASGEERLRFPHEDTVVGTTWSKDETRILTWSNDGIIRVWVVDVSTLIEIGEARVNRELSNADRERFFLPTIEPPSRE